jgi:hypothetical protein
MQRRLYNKHLHLYRGRGPSSHLWGFSQALAATTSVYQLPAVGPSYLSDLHDRLTGLDQYWDPAWVPPGYTASVAPPRGPGGQLFYDDNEWVGLELVRLYRLDHQQGELARASQIFDLTVASWDSSSSLPCPGGVPFNDSPTNRDRNVVTNAPGAELALELYGLTHDSKYLVWAKRMYDWVRTCLSLGTGLYADHIASDGKVDTTAWTYTQGVMIGAGVMLYQATGDRSYLDDATATAGAALAYFDTAQMQAEPPFFLAVYFRNLLLLDSVKPNPGFRQMIQSFGDWAWQAARHRRTDLFRFGDTSKLLDQAAMVQIYSLLSLPIASFY